MNETDVTGELNPCVRRRSAGATRAALLGAAVMRFARHGYDNTSVRDIARDAGVDAALVYRYFGSKEALFEAASVVGTLFDPLLEMPLDEIPAWVAEFIVNEPTDPGWPHPVMSLLRSANRDEATERFREHLTRIFSVSFAKRLSGPDAGVRAELFVAWLLGCSMLRSVFRMPGLVAVSEETLRRHLAAAAKALLEPDLKEES
ncbi:TetR/AcrR family transcriptional regulator [Allostreptomyces psammosilenae]|uniref:AcrR family transcriptional regulator n=1 Tax=Allostreptomyces psammosilenae TaxID=1892865 RepID=A0A852ZSD6_9ACTN|nr:TetR family transcriptional regulator [Allostreptomyces psammosilenae]NYI05303.1 AcrR family transcriptional regulator [Allostreptomyces psammosilenae]